VIVRQRNGIKGEGKEKGEKEREREKKEKEKDRSAEFKEPTVVKEPSSSLHLDTHKYKAQPFKLTRRKGDQCSRFPFLFLLFLYLFPSLLSLSLPPSLPPLYHSLSLSPFRSHRRDKFISRSCLFWTFHNIWPRCGASSNTGGYRSPEKIRL